MESKINTLKNIFIVALLATMCGGLAMILYWKINTLTPTVSPTLQAPQAIEQQKNFKPHPGTMTLKNLFEGKEMKIPIDGVPPQDQFVYFKNGKAVDDPAQADDREPILRQELTPLSKEGIKVSLDKATTIRLKEYGEKGLIRERIVGRPSEQGLQPPQVPKE